MLEILQGSAVRGPEKFDVGSKSGIPMLQKFPLASSAVGTVPKLSTAFSFRVPVTFKNTNVLSRPSYKCGMRSGPPMLPPKFSLKKDSFVGFTCVSEYGRASNAGFKFVEHAEVIRISSLPHHALQSPRGFRSVLPAPRLPASAPRPPLAPPSPPPPPPPPGPRPPPGPPPPGPIHYHSGPTCAAAACVLPRLRAARALRCVRHAAAGLRHVSKVAERDRIQSCSALVPVEP